MGRSGKFVRRPIFFGVRRVRSGNLIQALVRLMVVACTGVVRGAARPSCCEPSAAVRAACQMAARFTVPARLGRAPSRRRSSKASPASAWNSRSHSGADGSITPSSRCGAGPERLPRWPMRPGLGHGARSRRNLDYKKRRISFPHFTSPPRGPRNGAKKHVSFHLSALTDGEPNYAGPLHRRSTLELFVQPRRKSVFFQPLAATDRQEHSANPSQRTGRPRGDLRGRPAFLNAAANRSNRAAFLSPALAL